MTPEPESNHDRSGVLGRIRFAREHRLTTARMSEYIDGELATSRRARATRHLSQCARCRELEASLRRLVTALADAAVVDAREPAPEISAAVLARLSSE